MTTKIENIAVELLHQHQVGAQFTQLTGELALTGVDEAYAAQWQFHQQAKPSRGEIGGRKIALASAVQQQLCHIDHPIAGAIFANEIHTGSARLQLSEYHGLGIEYELTITLNEDTVPGTEYSQSQIESKIATAHPAFEMIIDRGADYQSIDPLTMIADNAWCKGIVLGDNIVGRTDRPLDDLPITLDWDSEVQQGSTSASNPLETLTWVVNLPSAHGQVLRQGEPVITGSVLKTLYPAGGEHISFAIDGLAQVELDIS